VVLDNSPTGNNVVVTTDIVITFNEDMNHTTVETSLTVSSTGRQNIPGTFWWEGNTMHFDMTDVLKYENRYEVTLRIDASDIAGNKLAEPLVWQFNTGNLTTLDSDADGMPDGWEQEHGLKPYDGSDADADKDNDGSTNLNEYNTETDPDNEDTDGDGIKDGEDSAPLDPKERDGGNLLPFLLLLLIISIITIFALMRRKKDEEEPEVPGPPAEGEIPEDVEFEEEYTTREF
jgi:hypothetical protein